MSEAEVPPGLRGEITWTLEIGVVAACILMLIGVGLVYGHTSDALHATAGRVSVGSLPSGFVHGDGAAYLLLGVLVLVVTPIVRVLLSLGSFVRARDVRFSLIVLYVLVVLSVGLLLGVVA